MDSNNLEAADAISLLPREILANILSLLPHKLAASTSVLSKNWRNVYALVRNLHFDFEFSDSVLVRPEEGKLQRDDIRQSFRNFVDTTLALQRGFPIKKVSLKCVVEEDIEMKASVCRWICDVVERGVLELYLSLDAWDISFLPSQLFTSKTLVKLTLGTELFLGKLPPHVSLPALKTLFINEVFFEFMPVNDLSDVLLPGCPVLEELFISHKDYQGKPYLISSQTIKRLSAHYDFELGLTPGSRMTFDTPSLVFLDYSDHALAWYSQPNFASLVEARLDLRYTENVERPNVTNLINGISNVETLHLSPNSADVISLCCEHGLLLPVFNNLITLSFGSRNERGWKLLPHLLEQCPKLETLTIQGLDGYGGVVTMHPYHVKVLRILGYRATAQELKHLKSFLGESECLELVQVEVAEGVVDDGMVLQTKRALFGDLSSSKCKIQVSCSLYS